MAAGAGPAPVLGAGGQPGSDGVELDIAETDVEVRLVERHRTEAALPEGAAPALALINLPGVAAMRLAERAGETVGTARDEEKVDVVGHQAPSPDRGPGLRAAVAQKGDIAGVIGVGEEGRLAPRAALGDVVRDTWQDQTGGTRHCAELAEKREFSQANLLKQCNGPCQARARHQGKSPASYVALAISPTKLFVAAKSPTLVAAMRKLPQRELVARQNRAAVRQAEHFVGTRTRSADKFIRETFGTAKRLSLTRGIAEKYRAETGEASET